MSDLPVRRYNEREVSRLLERAAELQRSSPVPTSPAGLTLSELEDIAREAGLDPAMLRRAASELELKSSASGKGARLAGAPLRIVLERTVPVEADEATFVDLISSFETAFGGPGQVGRMGRSMTWLSARPNSGRTQQVRISIGVGETQVRIEESFTGVVGGLFGGVLGGVGGGIGIGVGGAIAGALGSVALAFAFPAAIIGSTYYALRRGYSSFVRNRQQILERLMGDVVTAITTPAQLPRGRSPIQ